MIEFEEGTFSLIKLPAVLALALLPGFARPAQAQELPPASEPDSADVRVSAAELILPGIAGSALGTVGGFYAGRQLGWGGGDDPGLTGAVFGAAFASTLLTTVFIVATADGGITPEGAWGASAAGALAGVGAGLLALRIADGSSEALVFVVSYSVVQGVIASLLAATNQ